MRQRRPLLLLSTTLLAICVGFALIHRAIHVYDSRIINDPGRLDTTDWSRPRVAIVFGASVYSSGELSPTLEDRVTTAITLYRAGKIDRILVSGDNRHPSYNEPRAMQEYLISHAVAPRDVIVDYAGRSTYETCLRAHEIFGLNRAVLVTQRFHLPRALYIANELGLDASGVATDPDQTRTLGYQSARELLAEIKAYLNVRLVPPRTILGERLPIR
jgi:SanA protein